MTWAERIEEIWPLIEDAKEAWLADALEHGERVPVPGTSGDPAVASIRVPTPLHQRLLHQAKEAGPSLDELVVRRLG